MQSLDALIAAGRAAALVGLAELGDKSQLVCLVLGTRYGAVPVIAGAALAFGLLNVLAVAAGGLLATALDARLVAGASAALFAVFGALALVGGEEGGELPAPPADRRSGVAVTFGALFLAELGDKTQLAVAALATDGAPAATWAGGTLALVALAGLGAVLGQASLERLNPRRIRRAGGLIFLIAAAWAAREALSPP